MKNTGHFVMIFALTVLCLAKYTIANDNILLDLGKRCPSGSFLKSIPSYGNQPIWSDYSRRFYGCTRANGEILAGRYWTFNTSPSGKMQLINWHEDGESTDIRYDDSGRIVSLNDCSYRYDDNGSVIRQDNDDACERKRQGFSKVLLGNEANKQGNKQANNSGSLEGCEFSTDRNSINCPDGNVFNKTSSVNNLSRTVKDINSTVEDTNDNRRGNSTGR